ncbi:MAG: GTP 3',8-cyclase MoaA, partial [Thermoanaerobaculia bacterium]|nr:GTP 3',8-cyclase MoaA [Thermoanaerobaculia bacterium]
MVANRLPVDRLSRPLRDLRVSVTDRCNFRCAYCMPREVFGADYEFLPRSEILSYEEIARVVRIAHGLGVSKVRLTGGEPLLRADLPKLVEMLAAIGELDLALTTNGVLLPKMATDLAAAGLERINVSLDSIDDAVFRRMNDAGVGVGEVLAGIEAADRAGLSPIKINAVVVRGVNDDGIVDLVRHFQGSGHIVRLIEYMDVGTSNDWKVDQVVTAAEMLTVLEREFDLEPLAPAYPGEVAKRWRHAGGGGEIGMVTSISRTFCG